MRLILFFLLTVNFIYSQDDNATVPNEFRAVWVASVANISWPSQPGLDSKTQKEEAIQIIENAKKGNLNTIEISNYLDMEVIITARVDFFAGFGQFQLNVIDISEYGDGYLKREIEELKKKLSSEGIFSNKKEIPKFPGKIGILTASNSHALKDVCSKFEEKYPLASLRVYPTLVQGNNAPSNLIRQMKRINSDGDIDVILIVRGGGSLQDLMAFNNEAVVREISKSNIPTITGIGHEPDTTLSDYASDLSKETPTAAAVAAVPDIQIIKSNLLQLDISLGRTIFKRLESLSDKLINVSSLFKMNAPYKKLISFSKNFESYSTQLKNTVNLVLTRKHVVLENQLNNQTKTLKNINQANTDTAGNVKKYRKTILNNLCNKLSQLDQLVKLKSQRIYQINPKNILKKGYAIIRNEKDKIIKDSATAKQHKNLLIEMVDGQFEAERKDKKGLL